MSAKPGYEYLLTYHQSVDIERLINKLRETYLDQHRDRRLIEQMNSSARPMPRNIAEGYTRKGLKDYVEFLSFSRVSGDELLKNLQRLAQKWTIRIEMVKWEGGDKRDGKVSNENLSKGVTPKI